MEAKVETAENTDKRKDEVTQPTVVEVDRVYTDVVLGKVLLLTNELESLRLAAARSMSLHSTELGSQYVVMVFQESAMDSQSAWKMPSDVVCLRSAVAYG